MKKLLLLLLVGQLYTYAADRKLVDSLSALEVSLKTLAQKIPAKQTPPPVPAKPLLKEDNEALEALLLTKSAGGNPVFGLKNGESIVDHYAALAKGAKQAYVTQKYNFDFPKLGAINASLESIILRYVGKNTHIVAWKDALKKQNYNWPATWHGAADIKEKEQAIIESILMKKNPPIGPASVKGIFVVQSIWEFYKEMPQGNRKAFLGTEFDVELPSGTFKGSIDNLIKQYTGSDVMIHAWKDAIKKNDYVWPDKPSEGPKELTAADNDYLDNWFKFEEFRDEQSVYDLYQETTNSAKRKSLLDAVSDFDLPSGKRRATVREMLLAYTGTDDEITEWRDSIEG